MTSLRRTLSVILGLFVLFIAWHDNWWYFDPLTVAEVDSLMSVLPKNMEGLTESELVSVRTFLLADDGKVLLLCVKSK